MYINKNFSKVEASSTEVEVKKIKPDLEITKQHHLLEENILIQVIQ